MSRRKCRYIDGAIVCGGEPTTGDLAEIAAFRRYLRGEMGEVERLAYTLGDTPASDLSRVARTMEVAHGKGTLTEARETAGLSIGQAAKVTGLSRARLSELEAGIAPTDAERETLCNAYDTVGWVAPTVVSP